MNSNLGIVARKYLAILQVTAIAVVPTSRTTGESSGDIHIEANAGRPQLFFACCNGEIAATQALFADGNVIASLKRLNAGVGHCDR
jgi:hypothetical protein